MKLLKTSTANLLQTKIKQLNISKLDTQGRLSGSDKMPIRTNIVYFWTLVAGLLIIPALFLQFMPGKKSLLISSCLLLGFWLWTMQGHDERGVGEFLSGFLLASILIGLVMRFLFLTYKSRKKKEL